MNINLNYIIQFLLRKRGALSAAREIKNINDLIDTYNSKLKEGGEAISHVKDVIDRSVTILGKSGSSKIARMSYTIRDENDKFKKLSTTVANTGKGWDIYENKMSSVNLTQRDFSKKTRTIIGDLKKLAYRAALTIPIWLVLRRGMMMLFRTIGDGLRYIKELDSGLARARAVMHGVTSTSQAISILSNVVKKWGRDAGVSAKDATEAFYRMGTAGLSVKESLAGMQIALKTSIAMMGDSTATARALADIYNVMGDRIEGATTVQEKMQYIGSTIALLWKSNAFELSEYLAALRNFAPTAKNANLTLDEMLASLAVAHTLMRRAGAAGTELSRSMLMLASRRKQIETFLGYYPEGISKMQLLVLVLKKLNEEYKKTGDISTYVYRVFGIKGMKTTASLAADLERLTKTIEGLASKNLQDRLAVLNDLYEIQLHTVNRQLLRISQLKKQTVEAFLTSATGAMNYEQALEKIADLFKNRLIPLAYLYGEEVNQIVAELKVAMHPIENRAFFRGNISREKLASAWALAPIKLRGPEKTFEEWYKKYKKAETYTRFKILRDKLGMPVKEILNPMSELFTTTERAAIRTLILGEETIASKEKEKSKYVEKWKQQLSLGGKVEVDITKQLATQLLLLDGLKSSGYNAYEIAMQKLRVLNKQNEMLKEQQDAERNILRLVQNEIISYSEGIKKAFKSSFVDILKGTGGLEDLFTNIGDTMREQFTNAFAGGFTDMIWKSTGIGDLFGGVTFDISSIFSKDKSLAGAIYRSSKSGSLLYYDAIVKGSKVGANLFSQATGNAINISTLATTGGMGGVGGIFGNLSGLSRYLGFINKPMFTTPGATMPMPVGIPGVGLAGFMNRATGRPGLTWGQGIGLGLGTISSAYSASQTGGALGGVMSGLGTGMLGLAGLGFGQGVAATATSAAIPATLPWLGPVGLALALGSLFIHSTPPKWHRESTTEQTRQVTSRIDVTNRELSWVNRNLSALRQDLVYVLQKSAYFSERTTESFSIDSRRGSI